MRAENITREVLNARLFVDDAFDGQSRNARFECVWCDYKTQVSEELQEHMESCLHGFKDGEYADVEYISKYVRSCASGKPLARYEAEETNAHSAWWSSTQLFIRSKLSATYDFIAKNMNEEMSLEESARRERETRLLAYWDEAPDWNLDRILSEEQLQTIDDAFANSGDEGTQVSSSSKILEKERRGRRRDADSEIDRGRRRARRDAARAPRASSAIVVRRARATRGVPTAVGRDAARR
tara:strand:+ start:339 stop:1055 length:717 start_codon:yes stop_codon:yes gene_type:complete